MSNKILQILRGVSFVAIGALVGASIVSIFTGIDYNWDIACKSFIAIIIAYAACRFLERAACRLLERRLDGSSRDD